MLSQNGYTAIGPPRPAKFTIKPNYLLNLGSPSFGTEDEFARTWNGLCFCFRLLCSFQSFISSFQFGLILWWKDKDSEKRTSALQWLVSCPQQPCSHMLGGEHSSLPQHTAVTLFSQQGITFPVLTLVLAQITNCLVLLPGLQSSGSHGS